MQTKFTMLIILSIILLMFSCKTINNSSFSGEYVFKVNNIVAKGLILKEHGEFSYFEEASLYKVNSMGSWRKEGKFIFLNSYATYRTDFIEVSEMTLDGERYIQVVDEEGKGVFLVNVTLNEKHLLVTDINGKIYYDSILNSNLSSIDVSLIGISNGFYKIQGTNSNVIIVKVVQKDVEKLYFENQKAIIKSKKIILRNRKFKLVRGNLP